MKLRIALTVCVAGALLAGGVTTADAHGGVASQTPRSIEISTSLDDLKVLPTRLPWTVQVEIGEQIAPESAITEVEYFIDGQLGWIKHHQPYFYGGNGNVLVTTFLDPGVHNFSVHVVLTSGGTVVHTVVARVEPAPRVPAKLLGVTWARNVTAGDGQGVWTVTAKSWGWFFADPWGGGANQDVSYRGHDKVLVRAYIEEPVWGQYFYGGAFCDSPDPTVPYRYVISPDGNTLTFSALEPDGCTGRSDLLQGGSWTRVRP